MELPEMCGNEMTLQAEMPRDLRSYSEEEKQLYDPYGLPFEPLDEFSDAPLEFEKLTEALWEDLTETYILAASYNRRSPFYLILCNHLEKNIRQLGSLCVTKAVLEQKDMKFPKLEGLTIKELYTMVSLHFRKCHTAFQDIRKEGIGIDVTMMDWVCRWASLAEKLKATEEKIRKIESGKISADSLLERAQVFKGESRGKRPEIDTQEIRNASSLPIIGSYAGELVRKKRQEDARKAREERERRKLEQSPRGTISTPMIRPAPAGDPERFERFLRRQMLTDARESGDKAAVEEIKSLDLEGLKQRYLQRSDENISRLKDPPNRIGPSDDVRRKLREKRKKKKR